MRRHYLKIHGKIFSCADEYTYIDVQICDDRTDNVSIRKGMDERHICWRKNTDKIL